MSEEKKKQINEIANILSNSFVQNGLKPLVHTNDIKTLREFQIFLSGKILKMMDSDYDLMINILYRMDISEKKLHELFAPDNREFIPAKLADLIIERQLEKIKWRTKYKNGEI